jgi:16S rRNA (guanine1516-N2)-methyltransferase
VSTPNDPPVARKFGSTDPAAATAGRSLTVDFVGGRVGYQFRHGTGRSHGLAKAVGVTGKPIPTVIDATAGLGRDAFLLASLGLHVTLIERCPQVYDLLADGLARATAASAALAAVIARMTLLRGDAKDLLRQLQADVVVVDPMHPPRDGAALVKKEMRALRALVGADSDTLPLMQVALESARRRVVLKWPRHAAPLPGLPEPSHRILGKTVRYDVFMCRQDRPS